MRKNILGALVSVCMVSGCVTAPLPNSVSNDSHTSNDAVALWGDGVRLCQSLWPLVTQRDKVAVELLEAGDTPSIADIESIENPADVLSQRDTAVLCQPLTMAMPPRAVDMPGERSPVQYDNYNRYEIHGFQFMNRMTLALPRDDGLGAAEIIILYNGKDHFCQAIYTVDPLSGALVDDSFTTWRRDDNLITVYKTLDDMAAANAPDCQMLPWAHGNLSTPAVRALIDQRIRDILVVPVVEHQAIGWRR